MSVALAAVAALLYTAAPAPLLAQAQAQPRAANIAALRYGYYRDPAVHGDTVIFTAEGDLWTVPLSGGAAHRLTTAPGIERNAIISPDGATVAFRGSYEGPSEVYTMPVSGGLPQRRTWDGSSATAAWAPDGRLLLTTSRYTPWRSSSLVLLDNSGNRERVPLAQGSEAAYSPDGKTLFLTRLDFQGSYTKRYQGGLIQSLWRYDGGNTEAVPITADFLGTSHAPVFSGNRLLFLSDRSGVMNVWTADRDGKSAKQLSQQKVFDVESISADRDHVVYASAGELWSLDPATGAEHKIPVTLQSDFDQLREHWVQKPAEYITDVHIAPDGNRALFTARGEVFSVPAKPGRIAKIAGESSVRFRSARFLPDGKSVLTLSTATGETEFWKYPATGEDKPEEWTKGATVLRTDGAVSPDGKWLAHTNKDQELWLLDTVSHQDRRILQSMNGDISDLSWSPDSHWLAFTDTANNQFTQVRILEASTGKLQTVTTDRYDSMNPVWSSDGKWLYFLSDRTLQTSQHSPWGPREPKPHFNRTVKVYELALVTGLRSPFLPPDELHPDTDKDKADEKKAGDDKTTSKVESNAVKRAEGKADKSGKDKLPGDSTKGDDKKNEKPKPPEVNIDFNGIQARIDELPAPAGNYGALQATEQRLCWLNSSDDPHPKQAVQCFDIANKGDEPDTLLSDVKMFEVSADRKKILLGKGDDFFIVDSSTKGAALGDAKVLDKARLDLSHWSFTTTPQEEYRGLFLDAWRLERDYFYDKHMHGVNWVTMRDRYLPLVDRVADRDELNQVVAQMVSELSALHTFVTGGDTRKPAEKIDLAELGADLQRDAAAGGFRVTHVLRYDPDLPEAAPPLSRPDSTVHDGEIITEIDGVHTLDVPDEGSLLRGKANTQVLLQVKSADGKLRPVLVKPVTVSAARKLRYAEWEYNNREAVQTASNGTIGYVHLRAMGSEDIDQWARDFYPVFDRQGLIVDVRHNNGGNIDSWVLTDLLRKSWMYFQPRVGNPSWNMQSAFRGHIVVLCDQETASDGEAFAEGFKRLGLGKVIGMRTWGGEIWLSFGDTAQADNGVASAAETGVYADGKWLIEGHGVDPDIQVDNLPHAAFTGTDAQLLAAVAELQKEIAADPRPVPPHPPYPDKSFKY